MKIPGVASITEWAYRLIAAHRDSFYLGHGAAFGRSCGLSQVRCRRAAFPKSAGVAHMVHRFRVTFAVQAIGLISGNNGILPASVTWLVSGNTCPLERGFPLLRCSGSTPSDGAIKGACIAG